MGGGGGGKERKRWREDSSVRVARRQEGLVNADLCKCLKYANAYLTFFLQKKYHCHFLNCSQSLFVCVWLCQLTRLASGDAIWQLCNSSSSSSSPSSSFPTPLPFPLSPAGVARKKNKVGGGKERERERVRRE